VRFFRRAIPVSIVAGLAVIVLVAYFNPFRNMPKLPIDPGKLLVSGTKITMEAPRLAGYTRDSRPYEMTAAAAAQDLANPGVLELKDIHAKVQMQDTATLQMTAAAGVYDTKTDLLHLQERILLTSSSGYVGRLKDAVVDIKKGQVTSDQPVVVEMLNGTLNANNLVVSDSGEKLVFGGGVVMNLMLGSQASADKKVKE
jgi:lipopolysaccharide export system protein LptC